ncbi:N-acetylmuramoyl-L-alanine amidase [Phosphitispora fastidiosa]|uniref:N-acetylmuramoyl-L-alanine amidase n=1 Tax=Phosphitispora fastidiosa TaxID=2837202 RepID=UPI001E3D05E0|nr:N-acetylmuramoyl-L-alanine amidase [Phosphitispora fastidiosa]MBU7006455.1 N-acetylmuramoyl-L-alanine amidase [Phosphitispora fastidiosa]
MSGKKCKALLLTGIIFTLFFLGICTLPDYAEAAGTAPNGEIAAVRSAYLNIRSGPGMGYSPIDRVSKGREFPIIKKSGGWYQVSLDSAKSGWIAGWLINVKAAGQGTGNVSKYLVVKESVVNIRSGPGTGYDIVSKTRFGEQFPVISQEGQWYQVILSGGSSGWIAGWLAEVHTLDAPSRDGTDPPNQPSPQPEEDDTGQDNPGEDNPGTGEQESPGDSETGTGTIAQLLRDIDFVGGTEEETVVIKSEGEIKYRMFTLKNPERLVIDIDNSDLNDINGLEPAGQFVNKIRAAQFSLTPMAVRVVVDLNRPSAYKAVLDDEGSTLQVTLTEPSIKDKVIVVDAGHGGYDPGAIGITGLQEKGFNLETALILRDKLEALGAEVILTRDEDTFISLTGRAAVANKVYADVFVSIHANASERSTTNGTSTYYYAPSSDSGLYAQYTERRQLADSVQKRLAALLGTRDIGILQGNLSVLRNTKMPSILVESAFLSNAEDERRLKDRQFREKVAQGIAEGLTAYFASGV